MRFDLLTTLPSYPQNELFNVWSHASFGHVDAPSLYTTLTDAAKASAGRLVTTLQANQG